MANANLTPWSDVYTKKEIDSRVALGAVAVTPTASPMTITAGKYPETIYVTGGTITSIKKGAVTLPTSGPFTLAPRQSLVITYSVVPSGIIRDRL